MAELVLADRLGGLHRKQAEGIGVSVLICVVCGSHFHRGQCRLPGACHSNPTRGKSRLRRGIGAIAMADFTRFYTVGYWETDPILDRCAHRDGRAVCRVDTD